eukprot:GHUV01042683.1.p1 GENE.GHUV01042683.1~~GHUV01042683.1.p1  ORF type:complete len:110 (-),score=17.25 GHUV01042683.1:120-449(-)
MPQRSIVKYCPPAGVFIGEAAQTLVQNADYEIPYLQKQMAKCNQQMADADRRQSEYTRAAETAANNYKKVINMRGIALWVEKSTVLCAVCHAVPCCVLCHALVMRYYKH